MRNIKLAPPDLFAQIQFVLTDMDETLTFKGRLQARTYTAMEELQAAGIKVIPVTAAPAGWADQMARMWPVDGVIAENGGIYFSRQKNSHDLERDYWQGPEEVPELRRRLQELANQVSINLPNAQLADDQVFRLSTLAYKRTNSIEDKRLTQVLISAGAQTTINNLWVLAWLSDFDKLSMAQRVLTRKFGIPSNDLISLVAYSGDSLNDASMFSYFKHTVGMSTITDYLSELDVPPLWITDGPGGSGFVEFANTILGSRTILET
jgi:HAD superfamily hydrolase (TIGR01484 family)